MEVCDTRNYKYKLGHKSRTNFWELIKEKIVREIWPTVAYAPSILLPSAFLCGTIQSFLLGCWYQDIYSYKENWNARSVLVLYTSTPECSDLDIFEKTENADPVMDDYFKSKTHLQKAFFNFFFISRQPWVSKFVNSANRASKKSFENIKKGINRKIFILISNLAKKLEKWLLQKLVFKFFSII